jgi:hypothetical protein
MTVALGGACTNDGKFCCSEYLPSINTINVLQDLPWTPCSQALSTLGLLNLAPPLVDAARCIIPY